eukprot:2571513-Rhodomonas_salina.2
MRIVAGEMVTGGCGVNGASGCRFSASSHDLKRPSSTPTRSTRSQKEVPSCLTTALTRLLTSAWARQHGKRLFRRELRGVSANTSLEAAHACSNAHLDRLSPGSDAKGNLSGLLMSVQESVRKEMRQLTQELSNITDHGVT